MERLGRSCRRGAAPAVLGPRPRCHPGGSLSPAGLWLGIMLCVLLACFHVGKEHVAPPGGMWLGAVGCQCAGPVPMEGTECSGVSPSCDSNLRPDAHPAGLKASSVRGAAAHGHSSEKGGLWCRRGVSVLGHWRPRRVSAGQASRRPLFSSVLPSRERWSLLWRCRSAGGFLGVLWASCLGRAGRLATSWCMWAAARPLLALSCPLPFSRPLVLGPSWGSAVPASWRLGRESVCSSLCPHRLSLLRVNCADPHSAQRESAALVLPR